MSDKEPDFSSLTPISIRKNIGGVWYELREASEAASVRYKDAATACFQYNADGKAVSVKNAASVEPLLISLCLFVVDETKPENQWKPVPEAVIRAWPARVCKWLFDKAKEISELNDMETVESLEKQKAEIDKKIAKLQEDSAKNEQLATADGSA